MNLLIPLIMLIVVIVISNVNAINPRILNGQQRKRESDPMIRTSASSCHTYYSKLLQTLLENYGNHLKQCKEVESEKLLELVNEAQQSREATTESLNAICVGLEECTAKPDNLDFFDCVDRSGQKSTRGVWKASKDSSDNAEPIRKKIHDIKYQTGRCNSEAERVYIFEAAEATDAMMSCYTEIEEKDQVEELSNMLKNRNEF